MKKMILSLALVLFAASAAAQPLQDFRYDSGLSISEDGSFSVTGGETVEANVSFDSTVSRELPLVVKLRLSSDSMKVVGEEFDLDATAYSENSSVSQVTDLSCSSTRFSRNVSVWKCLNSSADEIAASSGNTVNIEATAVPNIMPGEYDYELKILSEVGVGGPTVNKSVNASETVTVNTSNNETVVQVNSSADANVSIQQLTQVSDPNPEASEFVGGVSVDVSNSSGEVNASGVVTISYGSDSYDDEDVDVYYYNDTGETNEWVNVGGTQYPSNNTVSEEVDHFSTYGAFVQPVDTSPDTADEFDGGGPIPYSPEPEENQTAQNETEEDTDQQDTQDQQEGTGPQGEETTGQQETDEQQPEDTGPQQTSKPRTPAGQFFSEPGNVALSLAVLLIALVAALQYSGRIEVREYVPYEF